MKKKKLLWVVVALVAVNFLVGLQVLGKLSEGESAGLAKLDLIPQAMSIIQNNYVDSVDTEKLVHGAIRGMMDSLDIHSQFLPPVAVQNMQVDTTGTFGGLGIEITKREGFVTVISAMVNTPAYREGLMAGDRIVKIDDQTLDNPDLNDVVLKLRGEPGTKVTIMIVRYDPALRRDTIKTITITRAIVKVESVTEPRIIGDSIGYVRVTQFQERTPADLNRVLDDLEAQGMDSLILDLRDNPGGLLISAVKVTDLFLPGGHVIVSTRGRRPAQNQKYVSENAGTHRMYPLAVLINGASASGSEIVAGAIKDLKRGVLVGDKSYGKGSVQTILRLGRDTALRLTTAKYYTPSGVSIQDTGVEPNVSVPVTYEQEMGRRRQRYKAMENALENGKNGTEPKKPSAEDETSSDQDKNITDLPGKESEKEEEFVDIQLQEAVRILKALRAIGAEKMFAVAPVEATEVSN